MQDEEAHFSHLISIYDYRKSLVNRGEQSDLRSTVSHRITDTDGTNSANILYYDINKYFFNCQPNVPEMKERLCSFTKHAHENSWYFRIKVIFYDLSPLEILHSLNALI